MTGKRVLLLLVVVAVPACDPGLDFKGRVIDASGKPIAHADARIRCDGSVPYDAWTDDAGNFKLWRIGYIGGDCVIDAVDGNRVAPALPVMEHCSRAYRDGCTEVTIDIVLP
jgi:hypothetical protein